jgi:hypothetical protein
MLVTTGLGSAASTATEDAAEPPENSPGSEVNAPNSPAGKPPISSARRIGIGWTAQRLHLS